MKAAPMSRPASVVALEALNLDICAAALVRAGLPADTHLPSAPPAYSAAYAAEMGERRAEVFHAIEAAGRDAHGMARHFVEGMAAAYARATVPQVATDGAGYQRTDTAPAEAPPVADTYVEIRTRAGEVVRRHGPFVWGSPGDTGAYHAEECAALAHNRKVPHDSLRGLRVVRFREPIDVAPAMVPQPCQQQQAKARAPKPARGERRYVTVRDTETGEVHRVLTSVARVGVAVVIFVPSNRHRQGALGGMLITHDDIRKAWVFNDEAEAHRMLSRNRAPGERVIRAELVADPAPPEAPAPAPVEPQVIEAATQDAFDAACADACRDHGGAEPAHDITGGVLTARWPRVAVSWRIAVMVAPQLVLILAACAVVALALPQGATAAPWAPDLVRPESPLANAATFSGLVLVYAFAGAALVCGLSLLAAWRAETASWSAPTIPLMRPRPQLRRPRVPALPRVSTKRVGGLRFVKVGRLVLSWCVARDARPLR